MKKILMIALMAMMTLATMAQRISYDVIAKVPYDAKEGKYGQMETVNMNIVKEGNQYAYIGADRYDITATNVQFKDSTADYVEYTAIDKAGQEYTLKFAYDGTATHDVMKYFVIIFNNNDIYNWTYYYVNKGKEVEE